MTAYWDSSALILALTEQSVRERLANEGGITRMHSLSEIFSTLTGGRLGVRIDADEATLMIKGLMKKLRVVDLEPRAVIEALEKAKQRGVRGGRVHDYLHAVTAVQNSCDRIYTLNFSDFKNLFESLAIIAP